MTINSTEPSAYECCAGLTDIEVQACRYEPGSEGWQAHPGAAVVAACVVTAGCASAFG